MPKYTNKVAAVAVSGRAQTTLTPTGAALIAALTDGWTRPTQSRPRPTSRSTS